MKTEQSLNQLTTSATLRQILSAYGPAAELLRSIGLDPANHQGQTLRSVCQQRQWSEDEVLQWLKKQAPSQNGKPAAQEQEKEPDFADNVTEWCNYLVERYHRPLLEQLEDIEERFPRVKKVHGNQYPWLKIMQRHFGQFKEDFELYLKFESQKFFPLVRKINKTKQQVLDGTIRKLELSIPIIERDQHRLQQAMRTIHEKGKGFNNPEGACSTFRILNQQLTQLEDHLKDQFEVEQDYVIPLILQKLKEV